MTNNKVVLYLVRHGETTANVMGLVQGWCDFTLTENGIKGAEYLGAGLKGVIFSSAYSGDLTRQEKTARGVLNYSGNEKVSLEIDPDLREGNFGSYEGKEFPEVYVYYGYDSFSEFSRCSGNLMQNKIQDFYYQVDKENRLKTNLPDAYRAESSRDVEQRMKKVLTDIVIKQQECGGGNVLVVSSGMSINLFLRKVDIPEYEGVQLQNNSVTKIIYENNKFSLDDEIGSMKYFDEGKKLLELFPEK